MTLICALAMTATFTPLQARVRDAEVIEASLLQFYQKGKWQSAGWQHGEFVALNPKIAAGSDSPAEQIVETLAQFEKYPKHYDQKQLPFLKSFRTEVGQKGAPDPKTTALTNMRFDPRIVLAEVKREYGRLSDAKLKNREGILGTPRVAVSIHRPVYSPDGTKAFLGASAPWSIHHADIYFFLQKEGVRWVVRLVVPRYYV